MVKEFLVFLALIMTNYKSVEAQQITFDRMEDNNVRHIGTGKMELNMEGAQYDISLTVFSGVYDKDYCLLVSSLWRMEKNCIVLIKLGNEEIVKLIANNINVGQIDYPDYSPIIGKSSGSGVLSTRKVDYYVSLYSLENEILDRIEKYGVIKFRIAFGNSYYEKKWGKDRLGKFVKRSHERLEKQLKETRIRDKSIENGF